MRLIIIEEMRTLLIALLVISALSVKLDLSNNAIINDLNNFFTLSAQQADGNVKYSCQGLPQGFIIVGNQIIYQGKVGVQGQFPIKVTATDSKGQTDTQIVLLSVNLSGQGIAVGTADSAQTASNIASSISGSSPSLSSSSSTTTSTSSSSSSSASSGGAQTLTLNGVNYNLGNSVSLNLNGNNGGNIGSISSSPDINNLVSTYNTKYQVGSVTQKTISSYPSTIIVSGNLPNAVANTDIISIQTAQAPLKNQPINTLSAYDRNITNLFNQQTEVTQTIGNLLDIIRRQSTNSQQAQADINTYNGLLNASLANQQQIALSISQAEAKVNNIQNAINGANGQLDSLNAQQNKINGQISTIKNNGLNLTQQLSAALNNQDGLKNQINIVNSSVTTIKQSLASQSQSCSQANQIISSLKGNITTLQNSIAGIDQRIAGIDSNINDFNGQIAALQAQINALNAKIEKARADKQDLINLNFTVPQQIANINAQISAQQSSCQTTTYTPADLTAAQNQLSTLSQQLNVANNLIDGINSNITGLKSQLTDLLNQNQQLNQQIAKIQADIAALRQQLPQQQASLSKLYLQGNQEIQKIRNYNATLNAAIARYQKENNALAIANINLQQARSQSQKISQSINLILQENTAGLPFPSAPQSSGLTNSLSNVNQIDSITEYLISAYGTSLNFNSLTGFSSIRRLYNFGRLFSNVKSDCPDIILSKSSSSQNQTSSSKGLYSGLGTITKVNSLSNIQVNSSQGPQTLNLDDCSIKLANIPDYKLNVGDVLVWKGFYDNKNSAWSTNQLTCFH